MDQALREEIRQRARFKCEYCHLPEDFAELPFQIDHIIAEQHGGPTSSENLALACFRCNTHKGLNLSGWDGAARKIVRLFNPRKDVRSANFKWEGPRLIGLTTIGHVTISVLTINRPDVVLLRAALSDEQNS